MRYSVNTTTVASEVIDGEAIIMNMASGTYHSATGIGAVVWQAFLDECDTAAITTVLIKANPGRDVGADLNQFIDDLIDAGLIHETSDSGSDAEFDCVGIDYAAPKLMSYGDMQDLIMLDPIHDVSAEHGWPVRPAEAGKSVEGRP